MQSYPIELADRTIILSGMGVHGTTEESFFDTLTQNKVDTFIDVRQRRGLRGRKYRYANSRYLMSKLDDMGISYIHNKSLAPTTAIRQAQYRIDDQMGVGKRNRTALSKQFAQAYRDQILYPRGKAALRAMWNQILYNSHHDKENHFVFFCVEEKHEACHRSILIDEMLFMYRDLNVDKPDIRDLMWTGMRKNGAKHD